MTTRCTLSDLVEAHRATILVDDASFNDGGDALDVALAEETGAAERAAYLEFIRAQCQTADDVQAKLDYILNGSVGVRDTLLDCLIDYGDDLGERFLRSLVVPAVGSTRDTASRGSRAYACEAV